MSPLKRFAQAKESISHVYMRIHEQLQEVVSFLASVPGVAHKASLVIANNTIVAVLFYSPLRYVDCWNV